MNKITLADVRQALALPHFDVLAAQQQMALLDRSRRRPPKMEGEPRVGGVLLLLYCRDGELYVLLTRRRADLNSHAGQISFPGGRREEDEPLYETALRETMEEVGVPPAAVTILGSLADIYIPPSDYEVHPFVGWLEGNGRPPRFSPNPAEVEEILEAPLRLLLHPETRREEAWELRGQRVKVPFYDVEGHKVWGATAIMLSEFLERLRMVLAVDDS